MLQRQDTPPTGYSVHQTTAEHYSPSATADPVCAHAQHPRVVMKYAGLADGRGTVPADRLRVSVGKTTISQASLPRPSIAEVVGRYGEVLRKRAYGILASVEEAEEVVNDVFLKFEVQRERQVEIKNVEAYLKTLTNRRAIDYLRSRKRLRLASEEPCAAAAAPDPTPDQLASAAEVARDIAAAIAALPPRGREMFVLNRQEGLTYHEIAERCGVKYKTVETHISRALVALRNRLHLHIA